MKNVLAEGGWPLWLQLGALLIGLVGTVCLIRVDFKEKKEHLFLRSVSVVCSVLVVVVLMISAGWSSVQSNKDQNDRNNAFTNLLRTVTGGDSFPRLSLSNLGGKTNLVHLRVHREGRYPLYDVNIKLLDDRWLDKARLYAGSVTGSAALVEFGTVEINIPSITENSAGPYFVQFPPASTHRSFDIFYSARNGQWRGKLRLIRTGYLWQFHYTTTLNGTNLYTSSETFDEEAYNAALKSSLGATEKPLP